MFIVGKSGCGKSTLLNLLGGLDSFDEGDIIIGNRSMKEFTEEDYNDYRNSYVGFVFQSFSLINDYSVKKNIALGSNKYPEERKEELINEVLNKVELEGLKNRKPNILSGGQKQRVTIARALYKEPQLLLCDEPTGQLDSGTSKQIFTILKEINEEKLVVIVSHDTEAALNMVIESLD